MCILWQAKFSSQCWLEPWLIFLVFTAYGKQRYSIPQSSDEIIPYQELYILSFHFSVCINPDAEASDVLILNDKAEAHHLVSVSVDSWRYAVRFRILCRVTGKHGEIRYPCVIAEYPSEDYGSDATEDGFSQRLIKKSIKRNVLTEEVHSTANIFFANKYHPKSFINPSYNKLDNDGRPYIHHWLFLFHKKSRN